MLEIQQIPDAKGMKRRNILVLLRSFSCAVLFIAQLLFGGFVDSRKRVSAVQGRRIQREPRLESSGKYRVKIECLLLWLPACWRRRNNKRYAMVLLLVEINSGQQMRPFRHRDTGQLRDATW